MAFLSKLNAPPTRDDFTETILAVASRSDVVRKGSAAEVLHRLPLADTLREFAYWESGGTIDPREASDAQVVRAGLLSGGSLNDAFTTIMDSHLLAAYTDAESKSGPWVEEVEVDAFKPGMLIKVLDNILYLPRGRGAAELAQVQAWGMQFQVAEFARSLIVAEEDLVQDMVHAVLQAARSLGRGAKRLDDDAVFSCVLANPNLYDGYPLWSAQHGNLLTGAGSALSSMSLASAISMIRSQVVMDPNGVVHLELKPAYLVVPPALEDQARQILRLQKLDTEKTTA